MVKHRTHDRMSGGKTTKRQNSGSAGKKTTSSDETNHAVVSLLPTEEDSSRWVSTLAPLTLLKAASKHAAELNENRMLYHVSDATKAAMVTPTIVIFGLQMGGSKRRNDVYWNPNGRSSMTSCTIKSFKRHSQGMSLFIVCVFVF